MFDKALQEELKILFDKYDNIDLPKTTARIDIIEKDLDVFVKVQTSQAACMCISF